MTGWTARPSLPAGHVPTAAEDQAILDQISSLTAPGWTDYSTSLTWTSAGTAPAFGNAVKTARYRRPAGMDWVIAEIRIVFGTTTTFGTGAWFFSLPVAASAVGATLGGGSWYILNNGVQDYGGAVKVDTTSTFRLMRDTGTVAQASPATLGSTDELRALVCYEPAS